MKKYILFLVVVSLLSGCERKKPAINVPLPTQGPNIQDMQPAQSPN